MIFLTGSSQASNAPWSRPLGALVFPALLSTVGTDSQRWLADTGKRPIPRPKRLLRFKRTRHFNEFFVSASRNSAPKFVAIDFLQLNSEKNLTWIEFSISDWGCGCLSLCFWTRRKQHQVTWSGAEAPRFHVYIKTAMRPSKAKVSKQNHRPAYEQLFAHWYWFWHQPVAWWRHEGFF